MFRKIVVSRQPTDGRRRRWYQSDYFDLFIWYIKHPDALDPGLRNEIVGMQLCYDTRGRQRALEWHKQRGFTHHRVSKPSDSMVDHGAGSAALNVGGDLDIDQVLPRFVRHGSSLPPIVRDFVMARLADYARERNLDGAA